jgi:hypothetical protein
MSPANWDLENHAGLQISMPIAVKMRRDNDHKRRAEAI